MPDTESKLILVTRRTRLEELVAQYNTVEQARFYIEHLGADFSDYQREHDLYQRRIREASATLAQLGRLQTLPRDFLPNFIFGPRDTVVALGQDGLVANTMKYLETQPVIGVNPDPDRWDGVLLPFQVQDLKRVAAEVLRGRRPIETITMARAELSDGQVLHAVNDLFIGVRGHTSARYDVEFGGMRERQSSCGIIVSTGLGSTGWFKSIVTGAIGIAGQILGKRFSAEEAAFPRDADYLVFSVREPFPSRTSSANIVFGQITAGQPLTLVSGMADNGVIFSDGIEQDFVQFNAGMRAVIGVADKRGHLVI